MVGWQCVQVVQCYYGGDGIGFDEIVQVLYCIIQCDIFVGVDYWFFGRGQCGNGFGYGGFGWCWWWFDVVGCMGWQMVGVGQLYVFGQVDQYWVGVIFVGDLECIGYYVWQVIDVVYQLVVFDDWYCQVEYIQFLEGVGVQQWCVDLVGDVDYWY